MPERTIRLLHNHDTYFIEQVLWTAGSHPSHLASGDCQVGINVHKTDATLLPYEASLHPKVLLVSPEKDSPPVVLKEKYHKMTFANKAVSPFASIRKFQFLEL